MLDPILLRKNLSDVAHKLALRMYELEVDWFCQIEGERKAIQMELESTQAMRNTLAKTVGQLKKEGGDTTVAMAQANSLLKRHEQLLLLNTDIQEKLSQWMLQLPNLPHDSVPTGTDASQNQVVRQWSPKGWSSVRDFLPKDHVALGERFGLDLDAGSRLAGSRFLVMQGCAARLHRALTQFMLDLQTKEHGYTECYVPYLVGQNCLIGTGQLPKFEADLFSAIKGGGADKIPEHALYLIPTAEVALTNLVRDSIVPDKVLPMKLVAHTPCFRSEAGAHGRDTRGMIRQHQFEKIELVQITRPEYSYAALEEMVLHAQTVLQKLELPHQVVALCTGDLGFSAAKTYDLEVWLPSQNTYREIASISNCETFQSRRMQARFRKADDGKTAFLHTLNGSGVAVGRAFVGVLENHQLPDGDVAIPQALQPYLDGATRLSLLDRRVH